MTTVRAGLLRQAIGRKNVSLAYWGAAGVVVALLWLRWVGIRKGIWVDLDVYVHGAAALMRHESLNDVSVQGFVFTYPPFAAVCFVPLKLMGVASARWTLTAASTACYVLIVVVCARRLRLNVASAALVALVGLTFEPLLRNLLLGQINLVLLALIVVDCLLVPLRYRGILTGLATGIKLLPGAFILFLVLKREWWAAGRALAAFALTIAVGGVFAPHDSRVFWSGGFMNLSRFGNEAIIGGDNQSLRAAFMRLTHDLSPPPILVLLMSVGAMTLGLVAAKRQIDSGNDVNGLVCLGFASLLASPVSWTHHWVWAVVALLVLVKSRLRVASALFATIFVIGPMWFAPRGHYLELRHNWWQAAACLTYALVALTYLIFFAMSRHGSEKPRLAAC